MIEELKMLEITKDYKKESKELILNGFLERFGFIEL